MRQWSIQTQHSRTSGRFARVHFTTRPDTHLVFDLTDGVLEVFIGTPEPDEAQIYLEIDAKDHKALEIVSVRRPTDKQVRTVDYVLFDLGTPHDVRDRMVSIIRRKARANRTSRPRPLSLAEKQSRYEAIQKQKPPKGRGCPGL